MRLRGGPNVPTSGLFTFARAWSEMGASPTFNRVAANFGTPRNFDLLQAPTLWIGQTRLTFNVSALRITSSSNRVSAGPMISASIVSISLSTDGYSMGWKTRSG